jgi:membrane associated rhomboid family serine protease
MSFFGNRYGRRRRNDDVVALLLLTQLLQKIDQLPVKPPVTLGIMAVLGAIHFAPEALGLYDVMSWAFQPYLILSQHAWQRLWLSPLVHANSIHLYCKLGRLLNAKALRLTRQEFYR